MNKRRVLFENWFVKQFPKANHRALKNFDVVCGFADQTINSLWIGFNAGLEHR